MATHAPGASTSLSVAFDEACLTDGQIKELLQEAEARLRQSSSLQVNPSSHEAPSLPSFKIDTAIKPYLDVAKGTTRVDASYLRRKEDRNLAERVRTVETATARKQRLKQEKEATAGPDWFNLPRTKLTPELKRDLQLLNLRSVLDPKRHYKKQNTKAGPPPFSQVGTIIESPAEYYSARLLNRDRKETLADEVMAIEAGNRRFKTAYARVQAMKMSGKKGAYRARMAKRSGRS